MNEIELKNKMEQKSGSVRAFAIDNDIPYTTIRSILERGVLNAKAETIFKICSALNIRPEEFSNILPPLPQPTESIVQPVNAKVTYLDRTLKEPRHTLWIDHGERLLEEQTQAQNSTIAEPLYEYRVFEKLSAGTGTAYWEDKNYDTVYFDEELDHDLASWVYGDSMEPKYLDGSVALIKDTGWDYDGAIYAVDWDGQSYIKKVYKEKDGLRLVSLNPKYQDKFAPFSEDPRIIGKVVGNFVPVEM